MAQTLDSLSQTKVTHAKTGVWPDGGGLYLQVTDGGSKSWFFRFTRGGRERRMGLGSLRDVGLAEARQLAGEARRMHLQRTDPIQIRDAERRARAAEIVTFERAFDDYFALKRPNLSNAKHKAQWQSTMKTYVFPTIGERPVADIEPDEIIELLKPIWHSKEETARRVLQRINAVFKSAIVRRKRSKANPCAGVAEELGDRRRGVVNHRALPHAEVRDFLESLRATNSWPSTRLAFEWLVLTATRSGETRLARWGEIDEASALWTIPAERMKAKRPHVVPLSPCCIEILQALRSVFPSGPADLLFPSTKGDKPLSDMTLTKVLRDMGLADRATAHGMRSSFRDWATEVHKIREVVAEAVLAHTIKDKTEAAYRRSIYLGERKSLMDAWASYCSGVPAG
jgi:integrase